MKICIFSDVHWSTASSLVRSRGTKYSKRLEQLLAGINWVNQTALEHNCEMMICAGDFMDKAQLSDEEITALKDISWNNLPAYFLCGNHESSVNDLRFSSLKSLEAENHIIITKPFVLRQLKCNILFIPYVAESIRRPLQSYINDFDLKKSSKPLIIISHNDIAGIKYAGFFLSKIGFDIAEIEANCDLFLNGHLHNSEWISKKVLNVGSYSAHNFTNDSAIYKYGIWILDTETLSVEFIENPYSFNFYKLEFYDLESLVLLESLKPNAVVSIKTYAKLVASIRQKILTLPNILENRIITTDLASTQTATIEELQTDPLARFIDFCHAVIPNSEILEQELAEICK